MSNLTQQTVPEGYKLTEVGVIPEDWEAIQVLDVCGFIVPGRNKPRVFEGNTPWITTPDLVDGRAVYVSRSSLKVSLAEAKYVGSKVVPKGSVIMTCVGELGVVALAGCDLVLNQQLHAFLPTEKINNVFLVYALKRQEPYFYAVATKTALPYINKDNCNKTPIPFPPIDEQEAIAKTLSDTDALIISLEKLIAKKRGIKTAAMQQLLTGKKRLPPFDKSHTGYKQTELGEVPEDWEVLILSDLCSLKSGATITAANIDDNSEYPCYGGNGLRGYATEFTHSGEYVLIGRQGALCGNIQYVHGDFFASEHALVATPSKLANVSWLSIYLERMNLNQYSESSAQPGLSAEKLLVLKLISPGTDEQIAIADVLFDMDRHIDSLLNRLSKTQQLKQGMMQELLTGKTRLIANPA